ncbi:MAG: type II secretion system protein N, partial [Thiothrix sp.]|nr:type II secretion system protein N [Thiothrix sp.]
QILWTLAGLTSFTASLLITAPLPAVAQQIMKYRPELSFAGVNGTLWKGQVEKLALAEQQLDIRNLDWTFAPKALFKGQLAADLSAEVRTLTLRGQCGVTLLGNLHCSPLDLSLDAANLGQVVPQAQTLPVTLQGQLQARLDSLDWNGQQLPEISGQLDWRDGKLDGVAKLALGGLYRADISQSASGNGATLVKLASLEEPAVVLSGNLSLKPQGDKGEYDVDVYLRTAAGADPTITDMLSLVGPQQPDGGVRLQRKGEIALP